MSMSVQAVFTAIEFIESHLREDLSVAQIADAAGYSLFHFMRKFNQVVHHTPYDYLMRRRLSEAARALTRSNLRILDIAVEFGFNDQETFSRVFRKMFRMTPGQYRKQPWTAEGRLMTAKTIADLQFITSEKFKPPRMEEKEGLVLCGLMTCSEGEAINPLALGDRHLERISAWTGGGAILYHLVSYADGQNPCIFVFSGVEEREITRQPFMVSANLPSGRYVSMDMCWEDFDLGAAYLRSTWLPGAGIHEPAGWMVISPVLGEPEKGKWLRISLPVMLLDDVPEKKEENHGIFYLS